MMGEKEKFIVRISCDPKIEPFGEDFSTKFVDKILTLRVEKVNESVISQLRDLMKEKGINELYAIDESKVLEIVKKAQAFDIIKEKKVNVENFINTCSKMSYKQYKFMWNDGCFMGINMTSKEFLAEEEYDLLQEVLVCH